MRTFVVAIVVGGLAAGVAPGQEFLGRRAADWVKELESKDAGARRAAAFALGKIGRDDGIKPLVGLLNDDDAGVKDAAAFALGEIAAAERADRVWREAGPTLREKLRGDKDARVQRSAAFALGSCGEVAAESATDLGDALRGGEPRVRQSAAWALARVGKVGASAEAVKYLTDALNRENQDPLVLRDVAVALAYLGRPAGEPAVLSLAVVAEKTEHAGARKASLTALLNLIGPELAQQKANPQLDGLVRFLHRSLKTSDGETKGLVAAALANLGEHAAPALQDLAPLIEDAQLPARTRGNIALSLAKMPKAIRELPDERARAEVIRRLAAALDQGKQYPVEVRRFTAEALSQIKYPEIAPASEAVLNSMVGDPDKEVRLRCAWCFHSSPRPFDVHKDARPLMLKAMTGDTFASVRYTLARIVAKALGGDSPKEVIDTLEAFLYDDSVKIFEKTVANVKAGGEGMGGTTGTKEVLGKDARFLAAMSLSQIGRAANRDRIIAKLKELAMSNDVDMRRECGEALRALGQ